MATRSTDIAAARGRREPATRPARPRPEAGAGARPRLDPELLAELHGGDWDHPWPLTPAITTPASSRLARQECWTLERMLAPFARDAFALGEERSVLDLHCGEGWHAQRLLETGAHRVLAVDDRDRQLRRARLLRAHFAIPTERLQLRPAPEWAPAGITGRFDLVLLLGGAERRLAEGAVLAEALARTRFACAIESRGEQTVAVAERAIAAGFASVERVRPPLQAAPSYVLEQRELLIARPPEEQ